MNGSDFFTVHNQVFLNLRLNFQFKLVVYLGMRLYKKTFAQSEL